MMYTSPCLPSQVARERQRDMITDASQERQALQAEALARAARPTPAAQRQPRRTLRTLLQPRSQAPA
jgi:hypothetical protein